MMEIISFVAGAILTIVIEIFHNKREIKKEKEELSKDNIQTMVTYYPLLIKNSLFAYEDHYDEIHYSEIREEMRDNLGIVLTLPTAMKHYLLKLHKYVNSNADYMQQHKMDANNCLKDVHLKLMQYGVDIYGDK